MATDSAGGFLYTEELSRLLREPELRGLERVGRDVQLLFRHVIYETRGQARLVDFRCQHRNAHADFIFEFVNTNRPVPDERTLRIDWETIRTLPAEQTFPDMDETFGQQLVRYHEQQIAEACRNVAICSPLQAQQLVNAQTIQLPEPSAANTLTIEHLQAAAEMMRNAVGFDTATMTMTRYQEIVRSVYNGHDPKAQRKSIELLRSWLSDEQRDQFDTDRSFDVIGNSTGKTYRIHFADSSYNVCELETGDRLCFVPKDPSISSVGDIMLTQKLALEMDEIDALFVANRSCAGMMAAHTWAAEAAFAPPPEAPRPRQSFYERLREGLYL